MSPGISTTRLMVRAISALRTLGATSARLGRCVLGSFTAGSPTCPARCRRRASGRGIGAIQACMTSAAGIVSGRGEACGGKKSDPEGWPVGIGRSEDHEPTLRVVRETTDEQEPTELWNRRNKSERRFVLLCKPCATDRDRTVWLAWKREKLLTRPDRLQLRWDAQTTWPQKRHCAHCVRIFWCFTAWARFCCPWCANAHEERQA
jgi:hypothetical protein